MPPQWGLRLTGCVAVHLYDTLALPADLPGVEGPHPHGDLNRRHGAHLAADT